MTGRLLDDCFLHDRDRLRHDEAQKLILERTACIADCETLPLAEVNSRVAASAITAQHSVPAFDNSAIDGFAFAHADIERHNGRLAIAARIAAGTTSEITLSSGSAARIFTGAPMPLGADSCVMQEDCEYDDHHVTIPPGLKLGANTRRAGEDVAAGTEIIPAGKRLTAADIAALAASGKAEVNCYKRLKVALISTGDELRRPGQDLITGQVYDANHYLLNSLLQRLNMEIVDYGIIADDQAAIEQAVKRASNECQVILSTGGASRGDADFIVATMAKLGKLHAWQLAVKPGRPLAMGQIGDTVFFGLPGNPVAAFVTFLLYGQPMLARLQGENWQPPQGFNLPTSFAITNKKPDRREFWRGSITNGKNGPVLQKFNQDGSGLITGLRKSTGLIEVPEHVTTILEGDVLTFYPYASFGL